MSAPCPPALIRARPGRSRGGLSCAADDLAVDGSKVHAKCKEAYEYQEGLVCIQCHTTFEGASASASDEARQNMRRVHFGAVGWCHPGECAINYVKEHAERCVHCGKPIMPRIGDALGADAHDSETYLELEDGKGKVHLKCHDAYREGLQMVCGVCTKPITSGAIYSVVGQVPAVQVHGECCDRWLEQHGAAEFHLLRSG